MTYQTAVLPPNDGDLYLAYLILGSNYCRTARHYGCHEASVRRRIRRFWENAGCPVRSDQ